MVLNLRRLLKIISVYRNSDFLQAEISAGDGGHDGHLQTGHHSLTHGEQTRRQRFQQHKFRRRLLSNAQCVCSCLLCRAPDELEPVSARGRESGASRVRSRPVPQPVRGRVPVRRRRRRDRRAHARAPDAGARSRDAHGPRPARRPARAPAQPVVLDAQPGHRHLVCTCALCDPVREEAERSVRALVESLHVLVPPRRRARPTRRHHCGWCENSADYWLIAWWRAFHSFIMAIKYI